MAEKRTLRFGDSHAYRRADSELRGVWKASVGIIEEAEIVARARCSPGEAFQVHVLRRAACAELLTLWIDRAITLRQLIRISLGDCPMDRDAQMRAVRVYSRARRALKRENVK